MHNEREHLLSTLLLLSRFITVANERAIDDWVLIRSPRESFIRGKRALSSDGTGELGEKMQVR